MLLLLYMTENEKVLDCFGDENCVMPKKLPACLTMTMKQASGICRRFECQETTPRGRGGKKVSGVFVAHYYGVRSRL